jgi:SAM-dependent methyltransferase
VSPLPTPHPAARSEGTAPHPTPPPHATARDLRRRVRIVRRHLGPGPYLDYGCGRGALLALLAVRGSATGFVANPTVAELARAAAPGCPVHTNPESLPAGVFRGVVAVTTTPPDPVTLATWRRVLVPGGRALLVGVLPHDLDGFTVRWTGQEGWRGAPAAVLESE